MRIPQFQILRREAAHTLSVLFPPVCFACAECLGPAPGRLICEGCEAGLARLDESACCPHCGRPDPTPEPLFAGRCKTCKLLPETFAAARSAFAYSGTAGAIIRRMKYKSQSSAAWALAELAYPVLEEFIEGEAAPEVIVPVPLALGREMRRGFNQAEELALAFGEQLRRPVAAEAVRRARSGMQQARIIDVADRLRNAATLFVPGVDNSIAGKRALLIDDVMTTGATVSYVSKVLMEAGASRVHVVTIARAAGAMGAQ